MFKLPSIYAEKVLNKSKSGYFLDTVPRALARLKTPPYISNKPEVRHVVLDSVFPSTECFPAEDEGAHAANLQQARYLILSTGRLRSLSGYSLVPEQSWSRVVGESLLGVNRLVGGASRNPALDLLHETLGGQEAIFDKRVSKMMTWESEKPWMQDTTIVVLRV